MSTYQRQSWRVTVRPSGQYRMTHTQSNHRDSMHITSALFDDLHQACVAAAQQWIHDADGIYQALEMRLRIEHQLSKHRRPGFRPGSAAQQRLVHDAKSALLVAALQFGRDWNRLRELSLCTSTACAIPDWLRHTIEDLAAT